MATFKKPKQFNPANRPAPTSGQSLSSTDFGLSDSESADSASGSDSETEKGGEETGGMNFLEYVGLQKSLRRATEQKMELADQLKSAKEALRKAEVALSRATTNNKMQISVLQAAQRTQLEEKDKLIDALKLTIEEIEEGASGGTPKTQGLRQMVETITKLSNEKRDLFVRAEENEKNCQQAVQDLETQRTEAEEQMTTLKAEIQELRTAIDPVKLDAALHRGGEGASSAEAEALRNENIALKDKLEIALAQSAAATNDSASTVSSAQAQRLENELKEKKRELQQLRDELKDSHAKIAGLESLSKSGTASDKSSKELQENLQKEIAELKKQAREQANQIEDLQAAITSEKAAHERSKGEIKDLKASLGAELNKVQGQAAAGENAKRSAEQQVVALNSELASERSALKSEKNAHEDTKNQLADSKRQIGKLKEEISTVSNEASSAMEAERQRHATAIQNAKAEAAAQLAEAKQRSADEMKELKQRMQRFGTILQPMMSTLKVITGAYSNLRKEARDLAATIAPAMKQCKRDLLKTLSEVDKQYKEMLHKYRQEMALRKKLHNELVDLRGNIRVFCRIRPIISEDGSGPDAKVCIVRDPRDDQLCAVDQKGKTTTFELDTVFSAESTQEQVFEQARDLVVSVIDGFNVCIFAYGQTGSGKTFTMEGSKTNPGLNRRALRELFDICDQKKADWSYEIEVSVLEIYNEKLRDLLSDDSKQKLEIKHGKTGPHVPGLVKRPVRNLDEVHEAFNQAKSVRATASTDMNELSSRSHMILVVYVTGTNLSTGVQTTGKLNLIDLAGSERVAKSGALEDENRLKEATNINQSLTSLGGVIHALGQKQKHVPYRDSKLTHLLQDSLGGQAKTLMVVQISPVVKNVSESVCSLNFAQRVRAVELGAAKKQTESAEIAALKKRIKELEAA